MRIESYRMDDVTYLDNGIKQLDRFRLQVFKGEIMGLISINSMGKDALLKLFRQNLSLHYGRVYYREQLINSYENTHVSATKIPVISDQSCLVDSMSVMDNLFVLKRDFKSYLIRKRKLYRQVRLFMDELGLDIDPNATIDTLSHSDRCVVEVVKAVVGGGRLIVICDISSFISATDLVKLHAVLRHYATLGISFLYVCNHHEEVMRICDRTSLMEDGCIIKVFQEAELTDATVKPYTRPFDSLLSSTEPEMPSRDMVLVDVCHLRADTLVDLTFHVKRGECLVLQDMDRTLLPVITAVLSGERMADSGSLWLNGKPLGQTYALRRQIAVMTELPSTTMLFPDMSCLDNLCFCADHRIKGLWLRPRARASIRRELMAENERLCQTDPMLLREQEKYTLIYHRILLQKPKVLFCVNPFSGADMYLRMHILKLMGKLRKRGIALVLLIVNLSDSLTVADRLLRVECGRVASEHEREDFVHLITQADI